MSPGSRESGVKTCRDGYVVDRRRGRWRRRRWVAACGAGEVRWCLFSSVAVERESEEVWEQGGHVGEESTMARKRCRSLPNVALPQRRTCYADVRCTARWCWWPRQLVERYVIWHWRECGSGSGRRASRAVATRAQQRSKARRRSCGQTARDWPHAAVAAAATAFWCPRHTNRTPGGLNQPLGPTSNHMVELYCHERLQMNESRSHGNTCSSLLLVMTTLAHVNNADSGTTAVVAAHFSMRNITLQLYT